MKHGMNHINVVWTGLVASAFVTADMTTSRAEEPKTAGRDDFLGCWIMTEPQGIMFQTDSSKKSGYQVAIETMMMSLEALEGGEPNRNLVKGSSDVWSETGQYYTPTRYFNSAYDPVFGTIEQGAPGDGNSTLHLVDDQIIFVNHKSPSKSSDMSVRYLKRIECAEIERIREENHEKYKNLATSKDAGKLGE